MIQNPFIYCSTQDVFEHLTEELAQLFLILLLKKLILEKDFTCEFVYVFLFYL